MGLGDELLWWLCATPCRREWLAWSPEGQLRGGPGAGAHVQGTLGRHGPRPTCSGDSLSRTGEEWPGQGLLLRSFLTAMRVFTDATDHPWAHSVPGN